MVSVPHLLRSCAAHGLPLWQRCCLCGCPAAEQAPDLLLLLLLLPKTYGGLPALTHAPLFISCPQVTMAASVRRPGLSMVRSGRHKQQVGSSSAATATAVCAAYEAYDARTCVFVACWCCDPHASQPVQAVTKHRFPLLTRALQSV
jgi:hypothetical protein